MNYCSIINQKRVVLWKPMANVHEKLIQLGIKLGYVQQSAGLCHGTTLRCLEAYLLGEQDKFINRINKIASIDNLDELIHQTQEKVKKHEPLTIDDLMHLEILAFYDSLMLYHAPSKNQELFNDSLSQSHIDKVSQLAASDVIQAKGGLSTIDSQTNSFTGKELESYLTKIQKIISDKTINEQSNLGFVLSDNKHAIGLFYQAKDDVWTLMDINQWPPLKMELNYSLKSNQLSHPNYSLDNLIQLLKVRIGTAFPYDTYTPFNISLLTTDSKSINLQPLNQKLQELSAQYPVSRVIPRNKKEGYELLCIAALHGDVEVVNTLMAEDFLPNQKDITEATPLRLATQNGHVEVIKALLKDSKVDRNPIFKNATPLYMAAQNGQLKIVHALLEGKANPNITEVEKGMTPLLMASQKGRIEIVSALLNAGASTELSTPDGLTPLYIAAQNGHIEIVQALLKAGADPNKAAADGLTPLDGAAERGHVDIVQALLKVGSAPDKPPRNGLTPLYMAAQNGHLEIVLDLLKAGADSNKATPKGISPLYIAAQNGHIEIAQALLNAGADPNKSTTDGLTPLYLAVATKQLQIVLALLNNSKIDPNKTITDAKVPVLLLAAQNGQLDMVEALLNHESIEPNKAMPDGATPFYTALLFNHLDGARRLLPYTSLSIAVDDDDDKSFINDVLSDDNALIYYLNQIRDKPEFMQEAILNNPVLSNTLITHRMKLWDLLSDPDTLKLDTDTHQALLETTLDSRSIKNPKQQHPLYAIFKNPDVNVRTFFTPLPETILEKIQEKVNGQQLNSAASTKKH